MLDEIIQRHNASLSDAELTQLLFRITRFAMQERTDKAALLEHIAQTKAEQENGEDPDSAGEPPSPRDN